MILEKPEKKNMWPAIKATQSTRMQLMGNKYITTQCGLDKYAQLKAKTGIFNVIRFYWFVFFASLRDGYGGVKLWLRNAKD